MIIQGSNAPIILKFPEGTTYTDISVILYQDTHTLKRWNTHTIIDNTLKLTQEETLDFKSGIAKLEVKYNNNGIYFCDVQSILIEERKDKTIFDNVDSEKLNVIELEVNTNTIIKQSEEQEQQIQQITELVNQYKAEQETINLEIKNSIANNVTAISNANKDISTLSSDLQELDDNLDSSNTEIAENNSQIINLNNNAVKKTDQANQIYATDENGAVTTLTYSSDELGGAIVIRTQGGHIEASTPILDNDVANKKYVDDRIPKRLIKKIADTPFVSGFNYELGEVSSVHFDFSPPTDLTVENKVIISFFSGETATAFTTSEDVTMPDVLPTPNKLFKFEFSYTRTSDSWIWLGCKKY